MDNVGFFSDERFGRAFITLMILVGVLMAAHSVILLIRG